MKSKSKDIIEMLNQYKSLGFDDELDVVIEKIKSINNLKSKNVKSYNEFNKYISNASTEWILSANPNIYLSTNNIYIRIILKSVLLFKVFLYI